MFEISVDITQWVNYSVFKVRELPLVELTRKAIMVDFTNLNEKSLKAYYERDYIICTFKDAYGWRASIQAKNTDGPRNDENRFYILTGPWKTLKKANEQVAIWKETLN